MKWCASLRTCKRVDPNEQDVFKQSMLPPFIEMLLDCLLGKSRDLLREDLIAVLSGMILTDLASFRERVSANDSISR